MIHQFGPWANQSLAFLTPQNTTINRSETRTHGGVFIPNKSRNWQTLSNDDPQKEAGNKGSDNLQITLSVDKNRSDSPERGKKHPARLTFAPPKK